MPSEFDSQTIERFYAAMQDSVDLINGILAGTELVEQSVEERQDALQRNAAHLEYMLAKDIWTTEDTTAVNAAIVAAYQALQE